MAKGTRPHESIALRSGAILGVGLGTAAFLLLALAGFYWLYRGTPLARENPVVTAFPQPRLETDPTADLRAFQAAQRAQLEAAPGRLPVAEAMAAIAARGAQAYAPLQGPAENPSPIRPEKAR